jgi:hypothetical protein
MSQNVHKVIQRRHAVYEVSRYHLLFEDQLYEDQESDAKLMGASLRSTPWHNRVKGEGAS